MTGLLKVQPDIRCEKDLLGFDTYVETLAAMIEHKDFKTPFCIGLFGESGCGKTSFMHLLEKRLSQKKGAPHLISVRFNAWRHADEEYLVISLLRTIEQEMDRTVKESKGLAKGILKKMKTAATTIEEAAAALAYGLGAGNRPGSLGLEFDISTGAGKEDLGSKRIQAAKKLSKKLSSLYYQVVTELGSVLDQESFRVAVFVDDLDRCKPDKAVGLLEAIKLFLDVPGYIFLLGLDPARVREVISYHYNSMKHPNKRAKVPIVSTEDYLNKMIQLPLELPSPEPGRKMSFIRDLLADAPELQNHAELMEACVGDNPRMMKRFLNVLAFSSSLAETIKSEILKDQVEPEETPEHKELMEEFFVPSIYMKWSLIVFAFPRFYNQIKGNRKRLIQLQEAARGTDEAGQGEVKGIQIHARLGSILASEPFFPDSDWFIDRLILLAESTVIPEDETASPGYSQTFKPGDLIRVHRGPFLYGDDKVNREMDHDYEIDVFPVTNQQYQEFIDETDHPVPYGEFDEAMLYNWDPDERTYPKGTGDHPVVLISNEDALAFCHWRSEKDGKTYRLPSEEEWEKAARGEDGRIYPWGEEFDYERLNCADYHAKRVLTNEGEWDSEFLEGFFKKNKERVLTSEVNRFPDGASPFGCQDMAGNVWEWTESWHDQAEKHKVLRGGSWSYRGCFCRCAERDYVSPEVKDIFAGFRCVRDVS